MREIVGQDRDIRVVERRYHLDHGGAIAETPLGLEVVQGLQKIILALMAQRRRTSLAAFARRALPC